MDHKKLLRVILSSGLFIASLLTKAQHAPSSWGTQQVSEAPAISNEVGDHKCTSDELRVAIMGKYPHLASKERSMNEQILIRRMTGGSRDEDDIHIPVVVHIVHQNGDENISDDVVLQGIQDLNDAFANAGDYYNADGVDTHIRFCLAQQDPDGLPTSGITRNESSYTYATADDSYWDLQLKDVNRWDPNLYLNIWLVAEIYSTSMGSGVAGYATLPFAHGLPEDGIVNEARWFGSSTDNSKVHIHEAGHYLGLYHTFQGGCNNNNCTLDGDMVCDTPPDQSTAAFPCGAGDNSCLSDTDDASANNPFRAVALGGLGDQPDMIANYMDYGQQACQHQFTPGQNTRMNSALQVERSSLLDSQGCYSSCAIALYDISTPDTDVAAGDEVIVTSNSVVPPGVFYQWTYNGEVISDEDTLIYSFNNAQIGSSYLVFQIINPELDCTVSDSMLFTVTCNPPAEFTFSPEFIDVDDVVTFDAFNPATTSYQWFLDGEFYSSDATFFYSSGIADAHHIMLIAGNGLCSDTSDVAYFVVGECAGGQGNRWVIGGGPGVEVNFNSGSPVVSQVPDLGDNFISSIEGIATMSDRNGNLLFYSDGVRIFNKNYEAFYTGLGSGGSSAQGVQIIPDPANDHEYYVFTDENFAGYGYPTGWGFAYVKVDMNLNGGLGGPSTSYTMLLPQVSEKQTAVRHCNGHDIWVICHGYANNWFYSYLITDEGISEPVISPAGVVMPTLGIGTDGIGYMKLSPQGDKLVFSSSQTGYTELFRFDTNTGAVTIDYAAFGNPLFYGAYGAEFSGDGSKLYLDNEYGTSIYQYDLSSGIAALMLSSATIIGNSQRTYYLGAMQLAPDGKIYIANSSDPYMDVIHSPNEAGSACNFEARGLELPGSTLYGINNILSPVKDGYIPFITGPDQVCQNVSDVLFTTSCGNNTWDYRGNNVAQYTSETEVSIDFTIAGIDTLICSRYTQCAGLLADTLIIQVGNPHVSLGPNVSVCSTGSVTLAATGVFESYTWNNGTHLSTLTVSTTGNYWVAATGLGGCIARDTVHVSVFTEAFNVPPSPIVLACNTGSVWVQIAAQEGDFTHSWYWPSGPSNPVVSQYLYPGPESWQFPIYYTNNHGCVDLDTVTVQKRPPLPPLEIGDDALLCQGDIIVLSIDTSICSDCYYEWMNGSNDTEFTCYLPGSYSAYRYDSLCMGYSSDYVYLNTILMNQLYLPDSLSLCDSASYTLDAGTYYSDLTWQDGSDDQQFTVTDAGVYWVEASTACGIVADTTIIRILDESLYELSLPDTISYCSSQLPVLIPSDVSHFYYYYWSNGTGGYVYNEGPVTLTAFYGCGMKQETVYIDVVPAPEITMPDFLSVCDSLPRTLYAPLNQDNEWSTGASTDSIQVTMAGTYILTSASANGCISVDSTVVTISDIYIEELPDTTICPGGEIVVTAVSNYDDIFWNTTALTNQITISDTGYYAAYAHDDYCVVSTQFYVGISTSADYELTLADSVFSCSAGLPLMVTASAADAATFQWSTGEESASALLDAGGWYLVTATFACGEKTDSTFLDVLATPLISLPADTVLCTDSDIILTADPAYENIWSTGEDDDAIMISEPGVYTLTSLNDDGCVSSDNILVIASDLFLSLAEEMSFCAGDLALIESNSNADEYLWSTGNTTSSISPAVGGTYSLLASSGDCSVVESINVYMLPTPIFELGNDTAFTTATTFTLNGPTGFESYAWSVAGEVADSLVVHATGIYTLTVTDENGCSYTDDITLVFPSPEGTDWFIDVPQVFNSRGNGLVANYRNVAVYDIKIFDAVGKLVSYSNSFPLIWDGTVNGTMAASAGYFYVINYHDPSGKGHVKKGKVLVVN